MQATSRFATAAAALAAALFAAPPVGLSAQGATATAAVCPAVMPEALRAGQPFAAIRYLADDALEGRLAGSPGEACAADYLAGEFRRMGLTPAGEGGTFFQALDLASVVNPHAAPGRGRNVIARLEGADPALADEVVIVGAHYDHLGHGGPGSLAPDTKAIHNGADDNASGVGALLSIAERLIRGPRPARSVVFLAFTGEESGLLGSAYYVQHPTAAPLEKVRAMLNLDMVGRLGEQPLVVYGIGTADEWEAIVTQKSAALALPVTLQPDGYGPSDHTSFYARDVPVLHFFTNVHDDYHRPSDTWEKIDRTGVERVAALVAAITSDVAARPGPLALQRGAGKPPAPQSASGSGHGAYLGTIPDYAPADYGVRLSGVRAGSPGEAAGFEPGDIIIRFAGKDVADLYVYTDVLREHRPGDEVEIVVLRDGKETTLHAVLGRRGQ